MVSTCPIALSLTYNDSAGCSGKGTKAVDMSYKPSHRTIKEYANCGNWFGPLISCWLPLSVRCSDGANIHIWCWTQTYEHHRGIAGRPDRVAFWGVHEDATRGASFCRCGLGNEWRAILNWTQRYRRTHFGGELFLRQMKSGHRAGHDAMLLAAATTGAASDRVVDLGAGSEPGLQLPNG